MRVTGCEDCPMESYDGRSLCTHPDIATHGAEGARTGLEEGAPTPWWCPLRFRPLRVEYAGDGDKILTAHDYTSTACQHGAHDQCRRSCKFCKEACRCDCH